MKRKSPATGGTAPIVASLRARLTAHGTRTRAKGEKAYLKSDLMFIGVPVPLIRRVARTWVAENPERSRRDVVALVRALWDTNCHELRSVGIAILASSRHLLQARDIRVVEELLRESDTWAHVDWLAINVAGELVSRLPASKRRLSIWARDENFWMRRSALLALLPELRTGGGDFDLFDRFASSMIDEREFFIRKPLGWILREVGKKRPESVLSFLERHRERASALTVREAAKYLPQPMRKRVLSKAIATKRSSRAQGRGRRTIKK